MAPHFKTAGGPNAACKISLQITAEFKLNISNTKLSLSSEWKLCEIPTMQNLNTQLAVEVGNVCGFT